VDPCLQRARLTPWDPLFALFFRFRRMIGDHGFAHGDDRVQHGLRSAVHGGDEVGTDPDPLLFFFITQQLRHPSSRLLFEAEILVQDVEDRFFGYPMVAAIVSIDRRRSSSMAAATEAMSSGVRTVFFGLRWRKSVVDSPAFTFLMMA
jgi:hypothetical protein